MAYLAGFVLVGFLFLAMHYFTSLTKSEKVIVTIIVSILVLGAIAYNMHIDSQREKVLNVVMRFNQNKTVECKGMKINNTSYSLSEGTYTFIGKENSDNYGQMFSVSDCN